jgi:hypothetical protein
MGIEIATSALALFLLIVGAIISVKPPEERQWKIVSATAIIAAGVLLFALTVIQATDRATEQAQAKTAERQLQDSLNGSQKEFHEFRGEIVKAQSEVSKPGSVEEKLDRINESLSKALGKPLGAKTPSTASPPPVQLSPPSSNPFHYNGTIGMAANGRQQLLALLSANGYKGPSLLFQLEICGPDESQADFYVGQTDVNEKNGFKYSPGECNTLWNQDAAQLYVFFPKEGRVKLSATSR